ncbi:MAG TPA: MBL fold metallo-hydrolase [Longimicrobiaceae bacterium]|nr:MBL fold metallo-hydrolase [Longimicrobiaceae bacterium]
MRLYFLGTGTSFGVPVIGCSCAVCRSADPRDRRSRHSVLLEEDGRSVLVDTPPELRLQLTGAGIGAVDAVWYTHCHADHTHGVDDLRAITMRRDSALPVYAAPDCARSLERKFDYAFDASIKPVEGTSRPEAELHELHAYEPVEVAGFEMLPLPVPHGPIEVYGFRAGGLGYITDAKRLPDRTLDALRGVRVLVLNALWFGKPHPTHLTVEEAVAAAREVGAERTYLTHLSHHVGHAELAGRLPAGILPAHDGLVVDI